MRLAYRGLVVHKTISYWAVIVCERIAAVSLKLIPLHISLYMLHRDNAVLLLRIMSLIILAYNHRVIDHIRAYAFFAFIPSLHTECVVIGWPSA